MILNWIVIVLNFLAAALFVFVAYGFECDEDKLNARTFVMFSLLYVINAILLIS